MPRSSSRRASPASLRDGLPTSAALEATFLLPFDLPDWAVVGVFLAAAVEEPPGLPGTGLSEAPRTALASNAASRTVADFRISKTSNALQLFCIQKSEYLVVFCLFVKRPSSPALRSGRRI